MSAHQLNRAILYSATILRKIVEDETEAEIIAKKMAIPLPKRELVHASLSGIKYPYIGEDGWTVRGKFCVSDYGAAQMVSIKAKDVCNWLLHSYVWGLVHYAGRKDCAGFLVASDFDREKYAHFIFLDEWQKLLQLVIDKGAL